jgi:uncharacterized protein (DUF2236 family)
LEDGKIFFVIEKVRKRIEASVLERVAGPSSLERRSKVHDTPGPRWFAPESPICRVHGDASMFVGGLRALLLQSLHPLAMAGVAGHSGYKGDPWGRLARTSYFLAVTTFGADADAREAVDRVKAIHTRVKGRASDGRFYSASDPHLLRWVHIAEVDSFLSAHQRYGARPLDAAGCDGYVADTARIAEALGVIDPPRSRAELDSQLAEYRPELTGTPAARSAARFLLFHPPLSLPARPFYWMLAGAAVALLPGYARRALLVPFVPGAGNIVGWLGGKVMTTLIRWALPPTPPDQPTVAQ